MPALNRITGQMEGIKRMIAERRYCPEIITQLRAIRAAVTRVEANMLEKHLNTCVSEALGAGDVKEKQKKIAELKDLYKTFGN